MLFRSKLVTAASLRPTSYDSGNVSIATVAPAGATAQITDAHGLGAIPNSYSAFLQCVSADSGFVVGDRIPLDAVFFTTWGNAVFQLGMDATNWWLNGSPGGNVPLIMNKTTGAIGTFDQTKWNLRLFLRLF